MKYLHLHLAEAFEFPLDLRSFFEPGLWIVSPTPPPNFWAVGVLLSFCLLCLNLLVL